MLNINKNNMTIADRLDEIYGGEGEFDKYFDSHIEQIRQAYESIEQIC